MVSIYPQAFSFDNYIKVFTNKYALKPLLNSLKMGVMTVGLCTVLAISSAFIIMKTTIKFRKIIELLIMLPWAIPASAVAINMINAFSESSIFAFNQVLLGSYILLPIAYCVKLLPMMTTTTKLSFENINNDYLDASKSMGASSWQTFKRVMVPLISPGVLAGGSYVFIRVIGEYTLSAFLSTASNKPISMAVVNNMFEYKIGLSMAYGTVVVLITFGGSLLFNYFKKD
jgi:iron(III) transport system permease protein